MGLFVIPIPRYNGMTFLVVGAMSVVRGSMLDEDYRTFKIF